MQILMSYGKNCSFIIGQESEQTRTLTFQHGLSAAFSTLIGFCCLIFLKKGPLFSLQNLCFHFQGTGSHNKRDSFTSDKIMEYLLRATWGSAMYGVRTLVHLG